MLLGVKELAPGVGKWPQVTEDRAIGRRPLGVDLQKVAGVEVVRCLHLLEDALRSVDMDTRIHVRT